MYLLPQKCHETHHTKTQSLYFFLCLFLRDKEHEGGSGRESPGQSIPGELSGDNREPDAGLELMNREIMT